MNLLDRVLNRITMYRLLVYALSAYVVAGIGFAYAGRLPYSPTALVGSLAVLLISAYLADRGFARLFDFPSNSESWLITALIIFLIVHPAHNLPTALALAVAGALSSVSKFILAIHGKHLFNPAALAAAFMSYWGFVPTTWWIGSSIFWPLTLVLGLAIVRKIRRFPLVLTFFVVSTLLQIAVFVTDHQPVPTNMKHALIASPLIFLATVMLTEPATMPPRRNLQMVFAALIAVLYVLAPTLGPLIIYPEVALLIGNLFAYAVSPKIRVRMQLKEIQKISDRVYNYVLQPDRHFNFIPGQYMEWTLADVSYDSRGNRRTLTIASSPTEDEVHLGIKYFEAASQWKSSFYQMQPGDTIYASQLAGNFTMKGHETEKLAFVAGGIGITPFRSMIKYLTDKNVQSDIVLLYIVSDPTEFAYVQELNAARTVGIKTIPVVTNLDYHADNVVTTKINATSLPQLIPDFAERTFFVSGSSNMVDGTKSHLHRMGVPSRHIRTDHFTGY